MAPAIENQSDILAPIRALQSVECGEEAARHFAFANGYRNLDHGAYGTYPRAVRDVYRFYHEEIESHPNTFIRYEFRAHLLRQSRQVIADYLKAPLDTCVYLPNTSNGIDSILRNLMYQPGDVIVCFDTMYTSFDYTLQYLMETTPVRVVKVGYLLPISDDKLCELFETTVNAARARGQRPRLALFDTINSLPSVRMPFERLTGLCKKLDVLSCIDGAHGVGHLSFELPALNPDFFVSNCHKWLFVPRGSAVLYVPVRNQGYLRATLPVGFSFKPLPKDAADDKLPPDPAAFVANFSSLGTLDDIPFLCTEAALLWRSKLTWRGAKGEAAVTKYLYHLAKEGGELVASKLGTEVLDNEGNTLTACGIRNVRLPITSHSDVRYDHETLTRICAWVQKVITLEHKIAVTTFAYAGSCWVRLDAQVYLTIVDFEAAAEALHVICRQASQEKW